jgi:PAS domain S-box-containing protein
MSLELSLDSIIALINEENVIRTILVIIIVLLAVPYALPHELKPKLKRVVSSRTVLLSENTFALPLGKNIQLSDKDQILIDMLNSDSTSVPFTITDPKRNDNPIIYASDAFSTLTEYSNSEIVGKNCRFLQGKDTKQEHVQIIRDAIKNEVECAVNILNYKKSGTPFNNEFFICPIRDNKTKQVVYYLGVQKSVENSENDEQCINNNGWVYRLGY